MTDSALPIVVLISGSGSNLQAIINAIENHQLHAEIRAVISNRPGVKGLQRAEAAGIPARVLDHTLYADRESFDQDLQTLIDSFQPGLVVLAGFMRILTEEFVAHYEDRMLNIHPSLLPEFRGLNTHQRVLDAGKLQHGVSVHFVTNELDSGPLIIQSVIAVTADDTAESLATRVQQQEHIIYPMAIGWFADGRLRCKNNRAFLDNQSLEQPPLWIDNKLVYT